MTIAWTDYPENWSKPGHIPRGYENEAILDRMLLLTPTLFAYKTADETILSNGTYQDDDHLYIAVEANGVYVYEVSGLFNSGTTPDFRHRFSVPSGTFSGLYGKYFTAANARSVYAYSNPTDAANTGVEGAGAERDFAFGGIFTCGSTGGTMQWQWAQETSTASNTIVRAGSKLIAYRAA